jgi:aspartyl-tRNA synthetase
VVRGINAGRAELARSELDELTKLARQHGAAGLVWAFVQADGWRSPVAKFLAQTETGAINELLEAVEGDLLLIVSGDEVTTGKALGALRLELAERFELIPNTHDIRWIVEFPMFLWNDEEERWDPSQHPFTAPVGDLKDPGGLRGRQYDLILDGAEIGGGSIRIHRRDVQERIFELIGIGEREAQDRFGFLLDALRYGAPPLGGIAMGIDRIVALIAGRENIREVIAFPKATSGGDPLTGAPAPVDETQLRELGLRLR